MTLDEAHDMLVALKDAAGIVHTLYLDSSTPHTGYWIQFWIKDAGQWMRAHSLGWTGSEWLYAECGAVRGAPPRLSDEQVAQLIEIDYYAGDTIEFMSAAEVVDRLHEYMM